MAAPKRKQTADTEMLRAEAQAALQAIDAEIAELDAKRLDLEPQAAVAKETALAAARRDAQRRVELLDQRAADELRQRQAKSQLALIGRVEAKFAERDAAAAEIAEHLAKAVIAFRKANAANAAAAAAWPFDVTDADACVFGTRFVAAVGHELYRINGQPFITTGAHRDLEFPGTRGPSITDPRPSSVKPLVERLREGSGYASRKMRGTPIRPLDIPTPMPAEKPVAAVTAKPSTTAAPQTPADEPKANGNNRAVTPEYLFFVDFTHVKTGERRTEEVRLSPAEADECFLDGIGPTGKRGSEAALRIAMARVPADFVFVASPDALRFDMGRLVQSIEEERS